jgi:hypothetical protein
MSWSLHLRNGDLALGGTRLGQVTGAQKLVQDLRCALLEPRGWDDAHPTYGSLLDGGRDDNGIEVASIVGTSNWERIALRVEGEIRRITALYQRMQLARAQQDRYTYGESTLSPDELLLNVTAVNMYQAQDTLLVRVTLQTGTGLATQIDIPISNTPVIA